MSSIVQQVLSWLESGSRAVSLLMRMSSTEPDTGDPPCEPEVVEAVEQGVGDVLRNRLSTLNEGGGPRDLL